MELSILKGLGLLAGGLSVMCFAMALINRYLSKPPTYVRKSEVPIDPNREPLPCPDPKGVSSARRSKIDELEERMKKLTEKQKYVHMDRETGELFCLATKEDKCPKTGKKYFYEYLGEL